MNSENALVEWLRRPETYGATETVECVETHISRVFLVGDHAYKQKKNVRFEFLDFSTPEARKTACEAELRLNRRLAGEVYEAVVPIYRQVDGTFTWEESGAPVDWVVRMRRLDTSRTLEQAIRQSAVEDPVLQQLSTLLNQFYAQATAADVKPTDYVAQIEHHVRANLDDLVIAQHDLPPRTVQRVHGAQLRLLQLQPGLFEHRASAGRVVDGHGDLRPEHIVLSDPPVVFDCLEFSDELRQIDVADELAFLAMECEQLGAPEVGEQIWESWCESANDHPAESLWSFYRSYRACVRAKVSVLRSDQEMGTAHDRDHATGERYLESADRFASHLPPPLVLVVRGLSGMGKSTLARELATRLCGTHLSTDSVRREWLGASPSPAGVGEGIYTAAARQAVYDEVLNRAEGLLRDRITPILDGTYLRAAQRRQPAELAQRFGCRVLIVDCKCPHEVAAARIRDRQTEGKSDSEARPELLADQRQHEEPPLADVGRVEVDTTLEPGEQVATVINYLRQ